jgi:hypothetical protein
MDMKLKNGIKAIDLANGTFLYFWYANNAGRGIDNCTIIHSSSHERAEYSRNQKEVLGRELTSAWNGSVNFSREIISILGLKKDDFPSGGK